MSTVEINGVAVDINDPCAIATELRKAELTLATGGGVRVARFGEDEVQFSEANHTRLTRLIEHYDGQCARKSGRVRRRARSVVWR